MKIKDFLYAVNMAIHLPEKWMADVILEKVPELDNCKFWEYGTSQFCITPNNNYNYLQYFQILEYHILKFIIKNI